MSGIILTERPLPYADLGPESPLPPLADELQMPYELGGQDLPAPLDLEYGKVRSIFPYLPQNGYERTLRPGSIKTAVLSNSLLRAEFALDLGGRLWSLQDVRTGRELLYNNSIFQPANLGLRNAWFAGGVEWNIGTRGHSPTTCEPLFAAVAPAPNGSDALRMWEYERLRGVVFQLDAWLDDDSPVLYVQVRIRNPHDVETPMYWWSNAAIAEQEGLRVFAPAARAYHTAYDGSLTLEPTAKAPWTYPADNPAAADYFFDIEPSDRPWIAAVTSSGQGIVQTSTSLLRGRKLFCWGQHRGGRRWSEWLTMPGGGSYVEIQSGLTATQYEHARMPARAEWRWIEAYAPLWVDPVVSHGEDWDAAVEHVASRLELKVEQKVLEDQLASSVSVIDAPPTRLLNVGGGWGALEYDRAMADGESFLDLTGTPFLRVDGPEYEHWRVLLSTGRFPHGRPATAPPSYQSGSRWEARLKESSPSWLTEYHLAVLSHVRGDLAAARKHYGESLELGRSAWTLRGLAVLEAEAGHAALSADLMVEAHQLAPARWQLTVETVTALLGCARAADALALIDDLSGEQCAVGRVRLAEVRAALAAGASARARKILQTGLEIPDLQEGEVSLAQLWEQACPGEPLPPEYDFEMKPA
ncbi:DUF5107 domain-containing protein [Tenggerimyces flavus]|uniref:DUF5107 domain-containing protein n=1 Tax=Tenggerimyces flavus TaxID=1708749 RepID=A0ABV7Y763_9ACTN|nr:DUF5107 domain-containing protein [Tenggerimyces flavus]MBM7788235.1 hypothetical protein [Tenggerimyces flavus]